MSASSEKRMMEWEIKLRKSISSLKKDIKREYDRMIKEMLQQEHELRIKETKFALEDGKRAGILASFVVFEEMINMSNYERGCLFGKTDVLTILNHNNAIDLFEKTKTYIEETKKGKGFEYLRKLNEEVRERKNE